MTMGYLPFSAKTRARAGIRLSSSAPAELAWCTRTDPSNQPTVTVGQLWMGTCRSPFPQQGQRAATWLQMSCAQSRPR